MAGGKADDVLEESQWEAAARPSGKVLWTRRFDLGLFQHESDLVSHSESTGEGTNLVIQWELLPSMKENRIHKRTFGKMSIFSNHQRKTTQSFNERSSLAHKIKF